jgi:hypothetical protein
MSKNGEIKINLESCNIQYEYWLVNKKKIKIWKKGDPSHALITTKYMKCRLLNACVRENAVKEMF